MHTPNRPKKTTWWTFLPWLVHLGPDFLSCFASARCHITLMIASCWKVMTAVKNDGNTYYFFVRNNFWSCKGYLQINLFIFSVQEGRQFHGLWVQMKLTVPKLRHCSCSPHHSDALLPLPMLHIAFQAVNKFRQIAWLLLIIMSVWTDCLVILSTSKSRLCFYTHSLHDKLQVCLISSSAVTLTWITMVSGDYDCHCGLHRK